MGRGVRPASLLLAAPLCAALLAGGCTTKETITQPIVLDAPRLVVTPDTLHILDTSPSALAYLSTDAPGTIGWRVTGKPSWVTATPESGTVSQLLRAVTIGASVQGLAPGTHGGTIIFHSGGGEDRVFVLFAVAEHPLGEASVTDLHFAAGESDRTFTLRNAGTGLLSWTVGSPDGWLVVGPPYGFLGAGQSTTIHVSVNRAGMAVGTASGQLTIASNSEGGPIAIPVTMEVPAAPQLATSPDTLRFDYFVNVGAFQVWNAGNAPLTWSAGASQAYVQPALTGGTVAPGETTTVAVTVDRAGLATGVFTGGITVTAAGLPTRTVGVSVRHFVETKWLLDETLADAEYDRVHDRIVAVGGGASPRLFVIDPVARTKQSVSLPLAAACVSIRPDGLLAAVGHNGFVTTVNLTTMAVVQTYAITTDALDIVLPANGWVYVFPRMDQWETIRCLNLATGGETLNTGRSIYAGTLGRLHPSGDFIYGANNGLSPSDFEKYDIRPGTAAYLYDSPYHGHYSFAGDLWMADDGQRIFARSGNVFRSTTSQTDDMTYNGSLSVSAPVQWVEHSSAAGRVYCLLADWYLGTAAPELRVYSASFLGFLGVVPLPSFLVPDGTGGGTIVNASGRFAFANAAGTRVHVLVKAAAGSGMLNDWAVASFDAPLP